MYKQIPLSNISNRSFKVYKEWTIDETDVPPIPASNETGLFDVDTSTQINGIYTHPLYHSIKAKYYSSEGNAITQYGIMFNPAQYTYERPFSDQIYVINLPQLKYGEQIKQGSLTFTDNLSSEIYIDDGFGALRSNIPQYNLISWDTNNQQIVLDIDGTEITLDCSFMDLNTGVATFSYGNETVQSYVIHINFDNGTLAMNPPLMLGDDIIGSVVIGNVFYDDGLIVITENIPVEQYTVTYRSTQTIHETEILVTAKKSEFNHSQNPSAVNVTLENSYDFETTKITNSRPAGIVRINEIRDIVQVPSYEGTIGTGSGTWNDYSEYRTTDPTGSYLSTYVTTIGLYDSAGDMIAVAKLPKPIKKLPDYDVSFLVRFDN